MAIENIMFTNQSEIIPPDFSGGRPYYGALFAHLAWQCGSTYRHTDHLGGCNGARIRFSPQYDWTANIDMDLVLEILQPVKAQFGDNLSWADLIVLAGTTALADGQTLEPFMFCGGRTDATNGAGSELLQPNGGVDFMAYYNMRDQLGLTDTEAVALMGKPRSASQMYRMGYYGTWSYNPAQFDNTYFISLLNETWDPYTVPRTGYEQYKARGKELYILETDIGLRWDADTLAIVQDFASDNEYFLVEFVSAWTKVMNSDRFDGPVGNLCEAKIKQTAL